MKRILGIVLCTAVIAWAAYRLLRPREVALPVSEYYACDHTLPLEDSVVKITDTTAYDLYHITYSSVHDRRVTALLSVPHDLPAPPPVIILLHGLGDSKTVDYVEVGNRYFLDAGYAVMRIDFCCHGERKVHDYDFDLLDGYRYWTRDIIAQTVFDLQRAVDLLEKRHDVDATHTGLFGISLGGITGTIFAAVDPRVKVPVIVLAGGQLNLMFGKKALSKETRDFLSIIDPINFVQQIAPRPLLMINAKDDDVVPPVTSKLLYRKARRPKKIIWYPGRHHTIPIDKVYSSGIEWFDQYLR